MRAGQTTSLLLGCALMSQTALLQKYFLISMADGQHSEMCYFVLGHVETCTWVEAMN